MFIAVQFEKYNLDYEKCIFKPIAIIRGKYDEERDSFMSDSGMELIDINCAQVDDEYFFGFPTTLKKLQRTFGKDVEEDALISNHFNMCLDSVYIGMFDNDGIMESIIPVPIYEIRDKLSEEQQELASEDGEEASIYFNIESLKQLRNFKTIEEVRDTIDQLIQQYNFLTGEGTDEKTSKEVDTKTKPKAKKSLKVDREASKHFDLAKLRKEVLSTIIAQDKAVDDVTTTIGVNLTSKNPRNRSHILIAGPSGTGKTEMINVIARELGVPCFKADATAYTKEGYVGKSVYQMLTGLLTAADGDLELAQRGFLIIDEIDKKVSGDKSDPSGSAVLNSLLKIMDRDVIEVDVSNNETISFDTSNLTMIFMGAFSDLFKDKKTVKNPLGFAPVEQKPQTPVSLSITNEDFVKYGMTNEFMGRIGRITYTEELTVENLVEILYKSKMSPIKIKREWFKDQNVKIVFQKSYCEAIAKKSLDSKTGARNLKKNIEESLREAQREVLLKMNSDKKVKCLTFTKETVEDPKKYYAK